MDKIVKIGDIYVSFPEGTTDITFNNGEEKEHHHESVSLIEHYEESPISYDTSIPPQHQFAEVNAETNISKIEKSWVRKSYFLLFIVFPSVIYIYFLIYFLFLNKEGSDLGMVIFFTFIFVPIIGFYLLLWNKDSGK